MRTETRSLAWFLRDPRCRKWIVQCAACGMYGRRSDSPTTIPRKHFEEMFPVMELDGYSQCIHCRGAGR